MHIVVVILSYVAHTIQPTCTAKFNASSISACFYQVPTVLIFFFNVPDELEYV